jgi:predicted small lipoprotein YifL
VNELRARWHPAASGRRQLLALLGLAAAATLAACGKKGPLRLPKPDETKSDDEETK